MRAAAVRAGFTGAALPHLVAAIDSSLPGFLRDTPERAPLTLAQVPADRVDQLVPGPGRKLVQVLDEPVIARELGRDPAVVCLDEDIEAAGGVFKTTSGLFGEFGPQRIWDTPISEQAIMGAAMTGMRPVAEIMFSNFFARCWDYRANEIAKMRYMTGGQVTAPLVVRTANGGGLGFGAARPGDGWSPGLPQVLSDVVDTDDDAD
jgi:hypothetical protein